MGRGGGMWSGGVSASQALPGARPQQLKERVSEFSGLSSLSFLVVLYPPTLVSPVLSVLVLTSVFFITVSANKCGAVWNPWKATSREENINQRCMNHRPQELAYRWLVWETAFSFNAENQLLCVSLLVGRVDIYDIVVSVTQNRSKCVCGEREIGGFILA